MHTVLLDPTLYGPIHFSVCVFCVYYRTLYDVLCNMVDYLTEQGLTSH